MQITYFPHLALLAVLSACSGQNATNVDAGAMTGSAYCLRSSVLALLVALTSFAGQLGCSGDASSPGTTNGGNLEPYPFSFRAWGLFPATFQR